MSDDMANYAAKRPMVHTDKGWVEATPPGEMRPNWKMVEKRRQRRRNANAQKKRGR